MGTPDRPDNLLLRDVAAMITRERQRDPDWPFWYNVACWLDDQADKFEAGHVRQRPTLRGRLHQSTVDFQTAVGAARGYQHVRGAQ